ncbi:MAG: H-type small acid-soluble spore protein [Herbinix sp.]|nr:H-type small acid-soluble spore protein [Herbinix sp.]
MNRTRASEIASSAEMVNVNYDGRPIYIEHINPNRDTASIHFLSQPENSQEVQLTQLVEP